MRAPVGDINRAWTRCCIGRGVGAIRHKRNLASFTYYTALELRGALSAYDGDGTVFGSINQRQLRSLRVVGSNALSPEAFDSLIEPIDALVRNNTSEILTLAVTRDLLLPKLMSGGIRLQDAGA